MRVTAGCKLIQMTNFLHTLMFLILVLSLCELINLPFVAQAYSVAAQDAAQQEIPSSYFLQRSFIFFD